METTGFSREGASQHAVKHGNSPPFPSTYRIFGMWSLHLNTFAKGRLSQDGSCISATDFSLFYFFNFYFNLLAYKKKFRSPSSHFIYASMYKSSKQKLCNHFGQKDSDSTLLNTQLKSQDTEPGHVFFNVTLTFYAGGKK